MSIELYRDLNELSTLSTLLARSGTQPYRSPEQACAIILRGRDFGMSPMTALTSFYMAGPTPALYATAMVALVRDSGKCASWRIIESSDERVTIETRRKDEEHAEQCTWTLADAARAGTKNMGKFPRQMLHARAASELARRVYPEVVLGLYSVEELDGSELDRPTLRVEVTPQPEGPDTSAPPPPPDPAVTALLSEIKACSTIKELQAIALKVRALSFKPSDPRRVAMADAHNARRAEIEADAQIAARAPDLIRDESAWRAHLLTKDNAYAVANSFVKRSADFDAAGVLAARHAMTCERLRALECVDPEDFIEAQAVKADERDAAKDAAQ